MYRIGGLKDISSLFEGLGKQGDTFGDGMDLETSAVDFTTDGIEDEGKAKTCTSDTDNLRDDICKNRGQ